MMDNVWTFECYTQGFLVGATTVTYTDNHQPCFSCHVEFSLHRTEDRPGARGHGGGWGQGGRAGGERGAIETGGESAATLLSSR